MGQLSVEQKRYRRRFLGQLSLGKFRWGKCHSIKKIRPYSIQTKSFKFPFSGLTWTNSLNRSVSFLQALATWAAFSDANARRSINLFILTRLFPVRLPPLDGVTGVKLDPDIPNWKSPSFDWHARYSQQQVCSLLTNGYFHLFPSHLQNVLLPCTV